MKYLIPLVLGVFGALGGPATAQSPVVVELFTSQGCSSCPPADKLMHDLAKRDDVIPLAMHVDYWDYIGWKDEFAVPGNAVRQRGYAALAGRKSVYTPQMIINGTTDIVGARPMELSKAIADHNAQTSPVTLSAQRAGDVVTIKASSTQPGDDMLVQMVRYQPERTSRITRGENAGSTAVYANVTQDWEILQEWDGVTDLELEAQAPGDNPVVVIVQQGRYGAILAATQIR